MRVRSRRDLFVNYLADNEAFFSETLVGRVAPLGSAGGAAKVGAVGVDTTLVSSLPHGEV